MCGFVVSRRFTYISVLVVLAACLSGCSSVVGTYGSVTGHIYISADASPSHPTAPVEFHLGGSPPRGFVPWAFAAIEVYGTSRQTVADAYGRFSLSGVPTGTRTLVFRDDSYSFEVEYYQPDSALVLVPSGVERLWTVMVYMVADNNLSLAGSNYMLADINEMEAALLDPNRVTVLAFADPLSEWSPRTTNRLAIRALGSTRYRGIMQGQTKSRHQWLPAHAARSFVLRLTLQTHR